MWAKWRASKWSPVICQACGTQVVRKTTIVEALVTALLAFVGFPLLLFIAGAQGFWAFLVGLIGLLVILSIWNLPLIRLAPVSPSKRR